MLEVVLRNNINKRIIILFVPNSALSMNQTNLNTQLVHAIDTIPAENVITPNVASNIHATSVMMDKHTLPSCAPNMGSHPVTQVNLQESNLKMLDKVITPVKHHKLNVYLDGYDHIKRKTLVDGFQYGFRINSFNFVHTDSKRNLISARQLPHVEIIKRARFR